MEQICLVCGAISTEPHYGADVCRACAAFFRRRVFSRFPAKCDRVGTCEITSEREVRQCKACRMEKCLKIGMQVSNVQSKRDKHDNEKIIRRIVEESEKSLVPACYSKVNTIPAELQCSSNFEYNNMRLKSLHRNFTEMLHLRKRAFPRRKTQRTLHHAEALTIFRKDVKLAADWINSTFPELSQLDASQLKLLFRNFYLKWTVFEPAYLAVLLGKPNTYHLPTGDVVDEVGIYYTRHLGTPPSYSLDEVSRIFSPYWTDFRNTLVDPVIDAKLSIHEFLLLCSICLFDVGLDGQSDECILFCQKARQELFRELNEICKHVCDKSENYCFRFAQDMMLLPSIQRGIDVFEEELQLGGLYKLISTSTDDWYAMVDGPNFEKEQGTRN
ncbi:hypothetical protein L3Y34_008663 [Caenorhabditis briggsae]|uniref:Uncharacterized protein n=1 Tax=Caenorhabditis briggsae TaxID=6238 RepID=A0AAE9D1Z6_CAEBR|nr:hypothetical protein L3Y34_008663 [Caenorhabditis briggsae]